MSELYPKVSTTEWAKQYNIEVRSRPCPTCGKVLKTTIPWKVVPRLVSENDPLQQDIYRFGLQQDYDGIQAIHNVASNLLENSAPLDPKYMDVINKNMADLLG